MRLTVNRIQFLENSGNIAKLAITDRLGREDQPLSIGLQSKINNTVMKGMFIIYLKSWDGSIREVLSCQLVSSNVLASRRLVTSTNLISVTESIKMKQQKRHKLQLFYDILSAIEQDMYQNEGTSLAKPTHVQQYT